MTCPHLESAVSMTDIIKAKTSDYHDHCFRTYFGHQVCLKDTPSNNDAYPRLLYRVGSQGILQVWKVATVAGETVSSYEAGTLLAAAKRRKNNDSEEGFIFYGQRQEYFCLEPVPQGKLVERVAIQWNPSNPNQEILQHFEMYKDSSGDIWKRVSTLVDPKFWHWGPLNEGTHQTSKTLTKEALLGS